MIIYEVSISIKNSVAKEWLSWMKNVHIPDVMKTQCFIGYAIEQGDNSKNTDQDMINFVISYECKSMKEYDLYSRQFADELQAEHARLFNGNFKASRQLLKHEKQFPSLFLTLQAGA